ncbi:hypothetical protein [Streptomyces sp. CBMA152]|uniref:hypothetical protein n=1 Tax=Streptomyces sp. CBMA152 TaxID=1896312 RepID=UPI00166137B7|nr:hypothetical protein [Streptomyces sp. CBMA152]
MQPSRAVAPLSTGEGDVKKPSSGHTYVLMVEYDSEFGLDQLPLVGQDIPPVKFSGLRTVVASATLTPEQMQAINNQLGQLGGERPPSLPEDKVTKGATFHATCTVPGMAQHTFRLHLGGSEYKGTKPRGTAPALPQGARNTTAPVLLAAQPVPRNTPTAPDAVPAAPAAAWLNVDKTFGPRSLCRQFPMLTLSRNSYATPSTFARPVSRGR